MKTNSISRLALAIVLAGALGSAAAQEAHRAGVQAKPSQAEQHEGGKGVLRLLPADAVTEHSIDTPKGKLAYTATAGTLAFYDQSGDQSAAVFYTAYVAKVPNDLGARTGRSLSCSTAGPVRRPPSCISAWSARAFSISGRTATTPRPRSCATIPTPGSHSPTWC